MLSSVIIKTLLSLSLLAGPAFAQFCNSTAHCPSTAPCCSQYGYCGTGSYCLGGCEPLYSYAMSSCAPEPVCKTQTTNFTDLSRVLLNGTQYNGNATKYDWIVSTGQLVPDPNGNGVRLTLNESNSGTLISSTRYIHYGSIDFVLETSKWAGVVTAAITMSDVKDEIDWEWPGSSTNSVQTNYYFLGIANYSATEGQTQSISSDASANFHTYSLDWQEDSLVWSIDGTAVRTVNKNDTFDGQLYKYPSTPSRIQVSIWAGGTSAQAAGTVQWAGGYINWNDPDYLANGYFWNTLQSISVWCATDSQQTSSTTGYVFTGNDSYGVPVVSDTNKSTISAAGPMVPAPVQGLLSVKSWIVSVTLAITAALSLF